MTNRMSACTVALALVLAAPAMAKKTAGDKTSADKSDNKVGLGLKGKTVAKADIDSKSGSKLKGTGTFTDDGKGGITLRLEVSDAPPGIHAVHIHEKGDCSSADGKSAGDHWNPTHEQHGKWGTGPHFHLGDIGNLEVKADGKGTVTLETTKWAAGGAGANDVIGHAIVVHGGVDDFTSQPAGNAGPRIGCGVIVGDGVKEKSGKATGSDPAPKAGHTP